MNAGTAHFRPANDIGAHGFTLTELMVVLALSLIHISRKAA